MFLLWCCITSVDRVTRPLTSKEGIGMGFTSKPVGRLPRATGMGDSVYTFGARSRASIIFLLGGIHLDAFNHPGETFRRYFEENGYEYEERATYDKATNTLTTNAGGCPVYYLHHIGHTCTMCGMKD